MSYTIIVLVLVILLKEVSNACPMASCSTCIGTICTSCITNYYVDNVGLCTRCMDTYCDTCLAPGIRCTKCMYNLSPSINGFYCFECN